MVESVYTNEKKKVLIVDDSEINREMLAEMLGDSYEYIFAEDGEHLLRLLSGNIEADILLLDMNMPNMNGMDVLKVMRERNWTEALPVIIISAENDKGIIRNAYRMGATDYIQRPFDAFMVQHRVENVLTMYSHNKQLVRLVENQVFQREKVNNMLINILSRVMETVNQESGNHTLRVQLITRALLERLVKITDRYSLTEEDIAMICSVSALHDIGKITVPKEILNKPGALTPEEWEIMKAHTVKGDEMLWELSVNQEEKLMSIAHEICRHHHERYDGKGYPDGLKEDEIPISAQTVSLADVYDALTSDRCYKKAYTHEKAIEMILNGECGKFNPLLLQCLTDIADELYVGLNLNELDGSYMNRIQELTDEVLEQQMLPNSDRIGFSTECEREKKEFFARQCKGIQFEYDAVARRVSSISYYDSAGKMRHLSSTATYLLNLEDWTRLHEMIRQTTRENPTVTMTALVPLNNNPRWQRVTAQTIWTDESDSYVAVVGQFTDIHDEMVRKGEALLIGGKQITGENFLTLRSLFDVVRLVEPATCQVLDIQKDGTVGPNGQKCYEIWNRRESCQNCTCGKALNNMNWTSKLETQDGSIFFVLSRQVLCGERECILELALCMEDSVKPSREGVGFLPDSTIIQGYYRDTLTEAYSRAYLDHFHLNMEKAQGVAVLDIDQFKPINDSYGHIAGDAALKHISSVIRSCIRKNDLLIRYGGDEFLLIFQKIEEKEFFDKLKEIKEAVHKSAMIEYPNMKLGISIGGAYCVTPLTRAIDAADKAMYRDKFQMKE